jgi:predicted dehydrogenase
MDRVRLGVIGGGRISDLNILGYLSHPKCDVRCVCDINEDTAKRRMKEWNTEYYTTDYKELLKDPDIDAVEILAPHRMHHPMVLDAARAGKHVSVQKPMCINLKEADDMIRVCKESGVKLKVFENFVFYPPYRKAKELIDAGEIGKPLSINIKLGNGVGGWWVPLKTWLWRLDYEECGGGPTVYDDGYHKLSLARYFFGEIDSVKAWVDFVFGAIDSPAMISWDYKESDRTGMWEVNMSPGILAKAKYYPADERVEIVGEKGHIWVTRCTSQIMEMPPLILYKDGESRSFDDMRDDWGDSFHDSGWDFVDSLIEDRDPFLTGEDGRALMQFWLAIEKSYKEGRRVKLEEVQDD